MHIYQGIIVKQADQKCVAAILRLTPSEPNCDTVMEHGPCDEEEATIWLDDEMSRLTEGRGVWDV
jgi:hypothetical protein